MPSKIIRAYSVIITLALIIIGALHFALQPEPDPDYSDSPFRDSGYPAESSSVLFLGNSHVFQNNLPFMLEHLAASDDRHPPLRTLSSTWGNATLKDHFHSEQSVDMIRDHKADFVILQGAGFEPFMAPDEYVEYQSRLATEAQSAGSEIILFQVWANSPEFWAYDGPDGLNDAFAHIEEVTERVLQKEPRASTLAPVGRAWHDIQNSQHRPVLYDRNGNLASPSGSYLAALVIYRAIRGAELPDGLWHPASITREQAAVFREFAERSFR